jgi:hypothetical protein
VDGRALAVGSNKKLRESPLHVGVARRAAEKPNVPAQVRPAGQAVAAPQAGSGRVNRDPLTGLNLRDVRAHLDHFPGHLVAEHHGFAQGEVAHAPVVIIMQVGPANAPGPESHQHLAFLRPRFGPILNFQVLCPVNDACPHKVKAF